MVHKIYVDKSIIVEDHFKDIVTHHFHSEIENVDFFNKPDKAVESINKWCTEKTFGKIKEVITAGLFFI